MARLIFPASKYYFVSTFIVYFLTCSFFEKSGCVRHHFSTDAFTLFECKYNAMNMCTHVQIIRNFEEILVTAPQRIPCFRHDLHDSSLLIKREWDTFGTRLRGFPMP